MKTILELIAPTVKAIITVVGFMVGLGWGAYQAVESIAQTQASVVEEKVIAVRNADMQHFDKRFDRLESMIQNIDRR